jgi:hypothetical protein
LAWIADDKGSFGLGNTSPVNKILSSENRMVACSFWGDFVAGEVAHEFKERVDKHNIQVTDSGIVISSLRAITHEALSKLSPEQRANRFQAQQQHGHGVIVAIFQETVRLYEAHVGVFAVAHEATGEIIGGDLYNPARIFPAYYYPICGRTLAENLMIGIHTMRLARTLNSQVIGEPKAWTYDGIKFRQLEPTEINQYLEASKSLDAAILDKVQEIEE